MCYICETQHAVKIHKGSCSYCNYGLGMGTGGTWNTDWYGPYFATDLAAAAFPAFRRSGSRLPGRVKECKVCRPQIDDFAKRAIELARRAHGGEGDCAGDFLAEAIYSLIVKRLVGPDVIGTLSDRASKWRSR